MVDVDLVSICDGVFVSLLIAFRGILDLVEVGRVEVVDSRGDFETCSGVAVVAGCVCVVSFAG